MSASGIKANLASTIGGVVFLVCLGLGLLGLQKAWSHNRQVVAELETETDQVQSLVTSKPYPPTKDNALVLRQDRTKLEELYQELFRTVAHPLTVPQLSRVEFASLLAQKLAELLKAARTGRVATPDQFAFGFGDYIAVLPPERRELLTHLTKELLVVEKISRLLISNHAEEIIQIRRLDATTAAAGHEAATAADVNPLYHVTPFEFQFVCSTESLRSFLNSLAQPDWIFVVRSLTISAHRVAIATRASAASAPLGRRTAVPIPGGGFLAPAGVFPPGMTLPAGAPPGRAPLEPAGKAERDLLTVLLRIDLVEFTPPQRKGRT